MRRFGPGAARCWVYTFKQGVLSSLAHDLKLELTEFEIDVSAGCVQGRFAAGSLQVVTAQRDGAAAAELLSRRDMDKIERTIRDTVLQSERFGWIRFESTQIIPADADAAELAQTARWQIHGELTLRGVTRACRVTVTRGAQQLHASAPLHQPDFGIVPYSAMMGALRIRPEVRVELELPLAAAPLPAA